MNTIKEILEDRPRVLEELLKRMVQEEKNRNKIAADIGIAPQTLANFLAGKEPTSLKTLSRIIKYLGMIK